MPVLVRGPVSHGGKAGHGDQIAADLHPDNQLAPAECFFVRLKSLGPAWECFKREPRSPVVVLDRDQIQRIGQPTDVARVLPGLTLVERRLLWREPDSCSVDVVSL